MLTIPLAAKELGLTRGALWKLAKEGEIKYERIGKFMVIRRSVLEAYRPKVRPKGRPKGS